MTGVGRAWGGINANKQIEASLTKLYEKHKGLFDRLTNIFLNYKENPTFFITIMSQIRLCWAKF